VRALFCLVSALVSLPVSAADIQLLSAGVAKSSVLPLIPSFARDTGHAVKAEFATAGAIQEKLKAGAKPDVVIVPAGVLAELEKSGAVAAGSGAALGEVRIGVAVREGAPLPDISSVEAFRRALLAAKSVAYLDPARGGTSGRHFAGVLAKLGIEDAVKAKAVLVPGGYAAEKIVSGEAELCVHQISEILPVQGVRLVGPLPPELQLVTTYSAGIVAGSPNAEAARQWIEYLGSPAGQARFRAAGLDIPKH